MKAVIFDLDGTLINSTIYFEEMKRRIIDYLQDAGVTQGLLSREMLNYEITTRAVKDLQQKGFTKEYIKNVLTKINEIMNEVELQSLEGATLVEGVPETLRFLKARNLKLGLMTRSCREYAERILAKFELTKLFDAVSARDDVENPKPNPEHASHILRLLNVSADEALFVGDHWSDVDCARKAGIRFILVGARHEQYAGRLQESGFKAIRDIRELPRFIEPDA